MRDQTSRPDPAINSHSLRETRIDLTWRRFIIFIRIFGVQSHLHRGARWLQFRFKQRTAGQVSERESNHPFNDINLIDQLGNTVLNLQSGVHLQKVILLRVGVVEEFDGASARIVYRSRQSACSIAHGLPDLLRQIWRGAFFNKLLIATL